MRAGEARTVTVLWIAGDWLVRVETGSIVQDLPVRTELEATRLASTLGSAMRRWRASQRAEEEAP